MSFKRKVLMPNGILYSYHMVVTIEYNYELGKITILVKSAQSEEAYQDINTDKYWTNIVLPLDLDISLNEIDEIVKKDPRFAEYEDSTNAAVIEELTNILTDEQAATMPQVYPEWQVDTFYEAGKRLQYKGGLYRVLQSHTAQASWLPTEVPAVYAEILPGQDGNSNVEEGQLPEWVQPESTNPYMKTDQVTHNGKN